MYRRSHYFVDRTRRGTIERFICQCLDARDICSSLRATLVKSSLEIFSMEILRVTENSRWYAACSVPQEKNVYTI